MPFITRSGQKNDFKIKGEHHQYVAHYEADYAKNNNVSEMQDGERVYEVEVSLVNAEAELCITAPEIVGPISTNIFTLNMNEETFIEFQLPEYQATNSECEITYSILSADPEVTIPSLARIELDGENNPLLVLDNAASGDAGIYKGILSATVGDSKSNQDFEFEIEVITSVEEANIDQEDITENG